jgi:NitT/TauT family transport system permease protein
LKSLFKIRTKIDWKIYNAVAIAVFVGVLAVWTILSESGLVSSIFLPSPGKVFTYFINVFSSGSIWGDIGISSYRIFMGFLIAVIIGVPLGILAGTFHFAEALIQPFTEFIRYMPVPAFVPLIMVWCGIGETAKIAVIFMGTLFQLIPMIADTVRAVPEDLLSAAYTLGAGRKTVIRRVILPAIAPRTMDTLRMMLGWAWTYLTVSELVAANSGLGYNILKAQRFLKTDSIFGGILIIGILGLLCDRLFVLANKKIFPWAEGGK